MGKFVQFSDSVRVPLLDADQTLLNPQEKRSIDKDIRRVIYSQACAQKFLKTTQIPRGKTEHRISIAVKPSGPKFSKDFLPESMDKIDKKEYTYELVGISKDYFLSMVTIDGSRNSDYHADKVDTLHLREMAALVADFKERVLWRGTDIRDADPADIIPNANGIFTDGSGTFEAGAHLDDNITAAGDGPSSAMSGAADLIQNYFQPPFVIVMTPLCYAQFCLNMNATTHITDIERIQGMVDKNGAKMFDGIYVTPHLLNAAETGTTAAMAVIAPKTPSGEPTIEILESYPEWHYPITVNKLGIQGKVLWMGCAAVVRPEAITVASAITTSF